MSKEIWLGPILSNNRDRLLARAAEVLASGPAEGLLYLAASRPLLELAANRLLDGHRVRGVWGSLPVHLFRGFARYVLATAIDDEQKSPIGLRIGIDQNDMPLKRSLVSQIIKRLAREGKLQATPSLAHREGYINSVVSLIGEIQRAGKRGPDFAAIIDARARDLYPEGQYELAEAVDKDTSQPPRIPLQADFDRDIALIYSEYSSALSEYGLSEDDSDQLRALEALRGEVDGRNVTLPWLNGARLLVLDGFFDFTPVQGEMLRLLIPRIPEVIVNLNRDDRNTEVFRGFSSTINQLEAIADFETKVTSDRAAANRPLSVLAARLFNPSPANDDAAPIHADQPIITHLECSSRETEIRTIAKRIKRLVLVDGYSLGEIALVVRELASYSDTIARVCDEESIPCTLDRRIQAAEVPAARSAVKLFELLLDLCRQGTETMNVGALADLIKSGYFRLSEAELGLLRSRFLRESEPLMGVTGYRNTPDATDIGHWDADELENVIAFVGTELKLDRWVHRARQLTSLIPDSRPERDSKTDDEDYVAPDDAPANAAPDPVPVRRVASRMEPVEMPLPGSVRKAKPARDIHPAAIAWSSMVVERFGQLVAKVPREAPTADLRRALMNLLEQLQFTRQVKGPGEVSERDMTAVALDLRGLEALRRALSAASRSIEIASDKANESPAQNSVGLATLLDETFRALRSQSLTISHRDAGGLKVLAATDVRGLKFRAVFIAGLIEGGFPSRASRDWIYPHEERDRLKRYGLILEDISPNTLLKEEHYFYQAACRATEQLCLTRPLVLEDGSETVASYYFDELTNAVAPGTVSKEVVRNDYDGRFLFESSRSAELSMLLIRQEERRRHAAQRNGNFAPEVIMPLISTARDNGLIGDSVVRRVEIERERGGRRFGKFDGIITDPTLLERLAKQYGADHDFSASELSLYGRCPFKFFAERLLKLEPRGEAALDLSALDAGSLLHEVLRRFFDRHRGERLTDFDKADLKRELNSVADEVFDSHERTVPPLNSRVWAIDREIRKLLLEQVLDYELGIEAKVQSKDVRATYFELAFGMTSGPVDPRSTEQRLRLYRSSPEPADTLLLRGQIDRVDVARDNTVIAYDYKVSRGSSLEDLREGRALQLHIYLAAIEQLLLPGSTIAGGGYYTMKGTGGRRNQGLYRRAFKDYTGIGPTTASNLDEDEWKGIREKMESRIWEFVDGMRAGGFPVKPSAPDSSCPHCDYSSVCRYEKFRIQAKEK